jgi:predicted ATP-grasp superfamily ATP-dependent carboligase
MVKIDEQKFCKMLSKFYKEHKGKIREIKIEEIEDVKGELFEEFFKKDEYRKHNKGKKRVKANKELSGLLAEKNNPRYKTHPRATYISRLLDYKNLPQPQNNPSQE